jgi:hypothetical protein
MNSFRKCSMVAGLLFVGLFIASAVTPTFAAPNLSIKHSGSTHMLGVTVAPYPNKTISKHMEYATSGGLTGLPDNNPPANNDPRANEPSSINVSF